MSTDPLVPDRWLSILRAEGVKVAEYSGWRTRERDDETGKPFGPVRMILNHHTAGRDSLKLIAENGRPGLPPPLAHIHLAKSGLATMCCAGRANHAGNMATNAYVSFRDEWDTHPAPLSSSGLVDGNDVSYGIETENLGDGEDVYPREQYDAWVRINTAICRYQEWSAESAGCHKETSVEGKIDPKGPVEGYGSRGRFTFTPNQLRADVAERLKHSPSWNPGEEEEPVTESTFAAVWKTDGGMPAGSTEKNTANEFWTPQTFLTATFENTVNLLAQTRSNGNMISALKTKVDALSVGGVDLDALATKVADLLAERLKS